jgi:hypothetical protein
LVIVEIGSCFMHGPAWSAILLFVLACVNGMTGQGLFIHWLRLSLMNFLPDLASNCDPPVLCLPSS